MTGKNHSEQGQWPRTCLGLAASIRLPCSRPAPSYMTEAPCLTFQAFSGQGSTSASQRCLRSTPLHTQLRQCCCYSHCLLSSFCLLTDPHWPPTVEQGTSPPHPTPSLFPQRETRTMTGFYSMPKVKGAGEALGGCPALLSRCPQPVR